MKVTFYIYALLTSSGTPFYVGKTSNLKRRMQEHRYASPSSKKYAKYPVYRKIKKMEREEGYKLKYSLLDTVGTLEEANQAEMTWIKKFRDAGIRLYNITDGGEGTYGHKPVFTEDWRAKLSASARVRALTNNSFKGKHHSAKTKQLLCQQRTGKFTGEENPFYGKQHSAESRALMSEHNKGKTLGVPKTELHRAKISAANKGKPKSPEHAAKNRDRRGRQDPRVKSIKVTLPDGRAYVCIDGAVPLTVFLKTLGVSISQVAVLNIVNGVTKKPKTKCRFEHVERPAGQVEAIVSCTN